MYRVDDVDLPISWLFTAHARGLDVFILSFRTSTKNYPRTIHC